jgi:hypothetical protein
MCALLARNHDLEVLGARLSDRKIGSLFDGPRHFDQFAAQALDQRIHRL